MKKLLLAAAAVLVSLSAFAQSSVQFNNRIPGTVDARVTDGSGAGVGAGWNAELVLVEGNKLTPLTPSTTFRTSSAAAQGYVNAVDVQIPGSSGNGGEKINLIMRAYNGSSFAASSLTGASAPFEVTLGPSNLPPVALANLKAFSVVPEPSTIALGVLGVAALLFRRRK